MKRKSDKLIFALVGLALLVLIAVLWNKADSSSYSAPEPARVTQPSAEQLVKTCTNLMDSYNRHAADGRNHVLTTGKFNDALRLLDKMDDQCGMTDSKRIEQVAALVAACTLSPGCDTG